MKSITCTCSSSSVHSNVCGASHVFLTMFVLCNVRLFKNSAKSTRTFVLMSPQSLQLFCALAEGNVYLLTSVLTSLLYFRNLLVDF